MNLPVPARLYLYSHTFPAASYQVLACYIACRLVNAAAVDVGKWSFVFPLAKVVVGRVGFGQQPIRRCRECFGSLRDSSADPPSFLFEVVVDYRKRIIDVNTKFLVRRQDRVLQPIRSNRIVEIVTRLSATVLLTEKCGRLGQIAVNVVLIAGHLDHVGAVGGLGLTIVRGSAHREPHAL